jgi:FMN reductase
VRVLVLAGSVHPTSSVRKAAEAAAAALREAGAEVDLVDLGDLGLPLHDGRVEQLHHPEVLAWVTRAQQAEAHLWVSPEFHSSFSGAVKNALDYLWSDHLQGKLVALIGVVGGALGAVNTLNALRLVARSMGAWVLPAQLSLTSAECKQGLTEESRDRLRRLVGDVMRFTPPLQAAGEANIAE